MNQRIGRGVHGAAVAAAMWVGATGGVFGQRDIAVAGHAWAVAAGNHRLTERWGLHTEYQWRRADWGAVWQQSLLRLGVDRYLQSGAVATAGYGWIRTFPYGAQPVAEVNDEHRAWEQLALSQPVGRVQVQHRYRSEQRWLEVFGQTERVLRHRVRYRAAVLVPLSGPWFVFAFDEVFAGWGPGVARNGLDQNRIYAALGYRFSPTSQLQLGYLNQFIVKADGLRAENNHTVQVAWTHNLDFRARD